MFALSNQGLSKFNAINFKHLLTYLGGINMIKTLNILFYIRKDRIDIKGKVPIYCRITFNKERVDFSVKRTIAPERWEASKGRVKGSGEDFKAINAYLNMVSNKIYVNHHKLEESNKTITANALMNLVSDKPDNPKNTPSIFKIFEQHNKKVKSLIGVDYAHGTWERFETCLKHLRQFIALEYNKTDYSIALINNEFISEFDYFLRSIRKCQNNSAVKYMRNFRKIIRIALANDMIEKDPFHHYDGKVNEIDRNFLTATELKALEEKEITTIRLDLARDIFLFSCYTGLAFIDVAKLLPEQIKIGIDGEPWIFTKRTKTKVISNIPLLPTALKMIDKYKAHPEVIKKKVLLPVSSNQRMNAYLKEIADICGINKILTFHIARHTFATTVTLSNGVPLESVSKMLGHKSIKTTQHYAKVIDGKVGNDMQILKDKLNL